MKKIFSRFPKVLLVFQLLVWSITDSIAQTELLWPQGGREAKAGTRWWWMGSAVDSDNLDYLIENYSKTGLGTLEITPIYGVIGNEANEIPFLSPKWMEILKRTYSIADKYDVAIEMNMGTGWPFGGSCVPIDEAASKLEYKYKFYEGDNTSQLIDLTPPEGSIFPKLQKVLAYSQDGTDVIIDLTELLDLSKPQWEVPEGKWLVIVVFNGHTGQMVKRAAPGGEGYVLNHFDSLAVINYINHFEKTFQENGVNFPQTFFCDSYEVYEADWTPMMFEEFSHYRGYKLEQNMDILLGIGNRKDTNNQVLADYRKTLSDMLYNNFARIWTSWCHKHQIKTRYQAHGSPANLLDLYALSDIPEIEGYGMTHFDIKGLRKDNGFTKTNDCDLPTLKFASSAAHVTGKILTSSESFTWLTEHFRTSLSQIKPDLDLLFCAGVNHVYFHGTPYSPREAQWPGWKFYASIDMSPTNSIWRDSPFLMDYISRCQSFLQFGDPDNDFLIYVPFNDKWYHSEEIYSNRLVPYSVHDLSNLLPEFSKFVNNLYQAGYDCDYISEKQIANCSWSNNQIVTESGQTYKALLLPFIDNLPSDVIKHIELLRSQGAIVLSGQELNSIDNLKDIAVAEDLKAEHNLNMIRRKSDNGYHYFVSNLTDKDVFEFVKLSVNCSNVRVFNPMNGVVFDAVTKEDSVFIDLRSGQSVILQTYSYNDNLDNEDQIVYDYQKPLEIDQGWQLSFNEESIQTFKPVYKLDNLTTWEKLDETTSYIMGTGTYSNAFFVSDELINTSNCGWIIDLGDVRESARVYINNEFIGCVWSVPYILSTDKVKKGWNTITVEVTNLPANRIKKMDMDGVPWRIFKDVNILSVNGAESQFAEWELVPSGLNSKVLLYPLKKKESKPTSNLQIVSYMKLNKDKYTLDGKQVQGVNKYSGIIVKKNRKYIVR